MWLDTIDMKHTSSIHLSDLDLDSVFVRERCNECALLSGFETRVRFTSAFVSEQTLYTFSYLGWIFWMDILDGYTHPAGWIFWMDIPIL